MLESIEAEPSLARQIAQLRHLAAVREQVDGGSRIEPIGPLVARSDLRPPHPMAGGETWERVGEWVLYERFVVEHETVNGYAGYRETSSGCEFVAPDGTITRVPKTD